MVQGVTDLAVHKTITVAAPQQRAFDVFTIGMSDWWIRDSHHIGASVPEAVVIEPRAGGRWFERAPDGAECDWGRVLEVGAARARPARMASRRRLELRSRPGEGDADRGPVPRGRH